jgi:hypothetical protein
MDGSDFDALTRTLTTVGSRRRALVGLMSGTLGLSGVWSEEATAKPCKKIKNKKKRKKCLSKAKTTPGCTRNCAGKTCGDDGCGGSCGDCFRGSCQGGVCVCPSGEDVCDGACMPKCDPGEMREPGSCHCCMRNTGLCGIGVRCCSGVCGGPQVCQGKNGSEDCTFGEQCRSGVCQAGKCTCDGDICDGICRVPCATPVAARNWETCACCRTNGNSCIDGTCGCCCSGICDGPVGGPKPCEGRPNGTNCTFDAQCASGTCDLVPAGNFLVLRCV